MSVHSVVRRRRGLQHLRRLGHDAVQRVWRRWYREADSCANPSFQSTKERLKQDFSVLCLRKGACGVLQDLVRGNCECKPSEELLVLIL